MHVAQFLVVLFRTAYVEIIGTLLPSRICAHTGCPGSRAVRDPGGIVVSWFRLRQSKLRNFSLSNRFFFFCQVWDGQLFQRESWASNPDTSPRSRTARNLWHPAGHPCIRREIRLQNEKPYMDCAIFGRSAPLQVIS